MNQVDYIKEKWGVQMMCSRKATLPKIFRKFGYKVGAEIGVERGIYSKILCSRIPDLKLYGIDAWQTYPGYRDHVDQDTLDTFFLHTKEMMKDFNFQPIRDFSLNAAKRFNDYSLDFVFIDAAHDYKSVKEDIHAWAPKVRIGGIVAGHDYFNGNHHDTQYGVKDAVNEWVYENNIAPLFVLKKDKCPSWFYVKT